MSQMNYYAGLVKGSLLTPNEGRSALNYKPVSGGDSIYIQQQNYSLEAIAKRDAKDDPFATGAKKGEGDGVDSE